MNNSDRILIQDNDCHWYLIPQESEKDFWKWVKSMENGEDTEFDFENNAIDGPHCIVIERWRFI